MKESSDRRGGPRPGFGGKQPGAGRPPKPVGNNRVTVILDPDTARHLDELRGKESRAAFLRAIFASKPPCPYCHQPRCECRPCGMCGEFPGACNC